MNYLLEYKDKQAEIKKFQDLIKNQLDHISKLQSEAETIKAQIKADVELNGEQEGFGYKAYIQIRELVTYNAEKFIAQFPKMADLVTEVIVNKDKIAGLLKGKILTEEELKHCKEVKTTTAFYLKEII